MTMRVSAAGADDDDDDDNDDNDRLSDQDIACTDIQRGVDNKVDDTSLAFLDSYPSRDRLQMDRS